FRARAWEAWRNWARPMPNGLNDPTRRKPRRDIPPCSPDALLRLSMTVPRSWGKLVTCQALASYQLASQLVVVSEFARTEQSPGKRFQGFPLRGLPADEDVQLSELPP